jgi:hypothetical protein
MKDGINLTKQTFKELLPYRNLHTNCVLTFTATYRRTCGNTANPSDFTQRNADLAKSPRSGNVLGIAGFSRLQSIVFCDS